MFVPPVVQYRFPLAFLPPATPGVNSFAVLAALEASARATLISVYPVLMYRALGDAQTVSEVYVLIGVTSLICALATPMLARFVPRRWLYSSGVSVMIAGSLAGAFGPVWVIPFAVAANSVALVTMAVCFNAYVMDHIERGSMGRNESRRLLFSGIPWSVGPFLGVFLMDLHPKIPFLMSVAACVLMLGFFWWLRLGNGRVISKARRPPANPLTYVPRFFRQPSLVAGWFFAVMRSIGWSIYIIYLPIFAVEAGLSDQLGGLALSVSNGFLFLTPVMLRYLQGTSVRVAIISGFAGSGLLFVVSTLVSGNPAMAIGALVAASVFLIMLDVSGGLPFLLTVKPSERTEMAAVYSTFRDVAAVGSPAFARLVLTVAPVQGVFAATGVVLVLCGFVARRTHRRLGRRRH